MNNTLHLYNRDRVQVAAHRGVAGVNIPCNTIPAFDIALHGGAAILEMDLFKSLGRRNLHLPHRKGTVST